MTSRSGPFPAIESEKIGRRVYGGGLKFTRHQCTLSSLKDAHTTWIADHCPSNPGPSYVAFPRHVFVLPASHPILIFSKSNTPNHAADHESRENAPDVPHDFLRTLIYCRISENVAGRKISVLATERRIENHDNICHLKSSPFS